MWRHQRAPGRPRGACSPRRRLSRPTDRQGRAAAEVSRERVHPSRLLRVPRPARRGGARARGAGRRTALRCLCCLQNFAAQRVVPAQRLQSAPCQRRLSAQPRCPARLWRARPSAGCSTAAAPARLPRSPPPRPQLAHQLLHTRYTDHSVDTQPTARDLLEGGREVRPLCRATCPVSLSCIHVHGRRPAAVAQTVLQGSSGVAMGGRLAAGGPGLSCCIGALPAC